MEDEKKCIQVEEEVAHLKEVCDQTNRLLKKRGNELDEKDKKIASLEEDASLSKYAGGLWAKDQILLYFPDAAPYVVWMEPPLANEPMVDIEGNDNACDFCCRIVLHFFIYL